MGVVTPQESQECLEIEEFRRSLLLSSGGLQVMKHEEKPWNQRSTIKSGNDRVVTEEEKVVCVTGGVSFLGLAVVNRLLMGGYSVRIIVTNEEDVEKLREMELSGEMRGIASNRVSAVVASFTDVQSLSDALNGCHGVFHTADIVDPAGLSGYSKSMADIEVKTSENVMEACARTESVRNCVLTSSLLACVWRDDSSTRDHHLSCLVNHHCWSDQSVCIDKKLWYALGKLRAEKAAWIKATEQRGTKLVTICPGLITGHESNHRNPTTTIAYLKGAQEMYVNGLLATVDVTRLAEAHVSLLEAMNRTAAFGRYICFDRVIQREQEVEGLARELGIQTNIIISGENESSSTSSFGFRLSNSKLSGLLSRTLRCSHEC